tara:strand:+ start:2080 stop:2388 length:309 start_codon:yes stop_codon:yes gene_type:complete
MSSLPRIAAAALLAACLPAAGYAQQSGDASAEPTHEDCLAEWTDFFGADSDFTDEDRLVAIDGLSGAERERMLQCDAMIRDAKGEAIPPAELQEMPQDGAPG